MRKGLLPLALGLSLASGIAAADVLLVPEGETVPQIRLPAKGTSMADVLGKYGEPRNRRPTVGGDSPQQPPITRWDYDSFSVIFERDKVIDGVIPGAPPAIVNRAGLERVPVDFVPAPVVDQPAAAPMSMDSAPAQSPASEAMPSTQASPAPAETPAMDNSPAADTQAPDTPAPSESQFQEASAPA